MLVSESEIIGLGLLCGTASLRSWKHFAILQASLSLHSWKLSAAIVSCLHCAVDMKASGGKRRSLIVLSGRPQTATACSLEVWN